MLYTEMRTLNIAISLVDEISPNVAETILSTAQETTKNICLCAVNLNEDVAAFAQIFEEDKVSSDSKPHISVIA